MFPDAEYMNKRKNYHPALFKYIQCCYFVLQRYYIFIAVILWLPLLLIFFHLPGLPGMSSLNKFQLHYIEYKGTTIGVFQYNICESPYTDPKTGRWMHQYCHPPNIDFTFNFTERFGSTDNGLEKRQGDIQLSPSNVPLTPSAIPPQAPTIKDLTDAQLFARYRRDIMVWKLSIFMMPLIMVATCGMSIWASYKKSRRLAFVFLYMFYGGSGLINVFMWVGYCVFGSDSNVVMKEVGQRHGLEIDSFYDYNFMNAGLPVVLTMLMMVLTEYTMMYIAISKKKPY